MKFKTLLLVIVTILLFGHENLLAEETTEVVISRALQGQTLIFERRYDDALKLFESLKRDYPESPAGDFGVMAVLEMRMFEQEDFHLENDFKAAAKEGTAKTNKILEKYHPGVWDLFLSGSLLGLDGFFKARKGDWWNSYVAGSKSRQIFRRVKEIDPAFVDADFGLGMYIFWRSVFARDLWFLKMFPDRKQEGINIVEKVAKNGRFALDLAKANLAIMYFEVGRNDDAWKILDEYTNRYPNNVILRTLFGKVNIAMNRYDAAIAQFKKITEIDPNLKKPHYFIGATLVRGQDPARFADAEKELRFFLTKDNSKYWQASAHFWLGKLEELKGNTAKAKEEYEMAVKLNPEAISAQKRIRAMGGGV